MRADHRAARTQHKIRLYGIDAQEQYTAESGAELKSICHELTLEKRRTQEQARKVRSAIGERLPAELVNIL